MGILHPTSRYFGLMVGEDMVFACQCGRECPLLWDDRRDTLVLDHGGEAVYIMPRAEWQAAPLGATFRLRDTSLMSWLERVHRHQRPIAASPR